MQSKTASSSGLEMRAAPPVYRPAQSGQAALQPKPAGNFKLESRPAPPVYRPMQGGVSATQPVNPKASRGLPGAAAQPKSLPTAFVVQRMKSTSEENGDKTLRNYKNLACYRSSFLKEVEKEFLKQGYNIDNVGKAIRRGLKAWGDVIPGHCSSKSDKDSSEQSETGPKCEEARDFLLDWVKKNPKLEKIEKHTKEKIVKHTKKKKTEESSNTTTSTTYGTGHLASWITGISAWPKR